MTQRDCCCYKKQNYFKFLESSVIYYSFCTSSIYRTAEPAIKDIWENKTQVWALSKSRTWVFWFKLQLIFHLIGFIKPIKCYIWRIFIFGIYGFRDLTRIKLNRWDTFSTKTNEAFELRAERVRDHRLSCFGFSLGQYNSLIISIENLLRYP